MKMKKLKHEMKTKFKIQEKRKSIFVGTKDIRNQNQRKQRRY